MIQSIISHSSVLHSPTPIVGPSPTTNPVAGLSQSIFLVIIIVSAIVGVVIVVILSILAIVIVVMVIV